MWLALAEESEDSFPIGKREQASALDSGGL